MLWLVKVYAHAAYFFLRKVVLAVLARDGGNFAIFVVRAVFVVLVFSECLPGECLGDIYILVSACVHGDVVMLNTPQVFQARLH